MHVAGRYRQFTQLIAELKDLAVDGFQLFDIAESAVT